MSMAEIRSEDTVRVLGASCWGNRVTVSFPDQVGSEDVCECILAGKPQPGPADEQ